MSGLKIWDIRLKYPYEGTSDTIAGTLIRVPAILLLGTRNTIAGTLIRVPEILIRVPAIVLLVEGIAVPL
ncbi:hypothetical protein PCANC_00217 [Puccinia coronata f. sp. avenae]|uniref:Uncharacterized protein n=1 Tax=Puccinia coronata f. sp. avenae TaxID=200324 RepID=A0A2N5W9B9_9BASI|nr:hypothetical protein PCANC_00217 [Puccinia coronata f. sp. avenae]